MTTFRSGSPENSGELTSILATIVAAASCSFNSGWWCRFVLQGRQERTVSIRSSPFPGISLVIPHTQPVAGEAVSLFLDMNSFRTFNFSLGCLTNTKHHFFEVQTSRTKKWCCLVFRLLAPLEVINCPSPPDLPRPKGGGEAPDKTTIVLGSVGHISLWAQCSYHSVLSRRPFDIQ